MPPVFFQITAATAKKKCNVMFIVLSVRQEVLNMTIRGIESHALCTRPIEEHHEVGDDIVNVGMVFDWIQIDSQDPAALESVVLAPTPLNLHQPTLLGTLSTRVSFSKQLYNIQYCGLLMQELDFNLAQQDLVNVLNFIAAAYNALHSESSRPMILSTRSRAGSRPSTPTVPRESPWKLYIEFLQINTIKINFSFIKSDDDAKNAAATVFMTKEDEAVFSGSFVKQMETLRIFLDLAMTVTSSISSAPIVISGKVFEHRFESPAFFFRRLQLFYSQQVLMQVYKICGSFDFFGNPISVVESLGTGVRDFFLQPAQGFISSPSDFALGAVRGTLSLVGNTTGMSNSLASSDCLPYQIGEDGAGKKVGVGLGVGFHSPHVSKHKRSTM